MTLATPAGPSSLRRHNLGLVLTALRAAGGASRAELAARTGLTRATVATLVEPLLGAGVLAEDAATPSGVGRPSRAVRFAPGGPVALGVAVDVDALSACAVALDGSVRAYRRQARDHRRLPPGVVFDGAAALTADVEATVGARVLGVGLALPALLSAAGGVDAGAVPTAAAAARPSATPDTQPGATPAGRRSANPGAGPGATSAGLPDATSGAQPDATPAGRPSATPGAGPGATAVGLPDATSGARSRVRYDADPAADPTVVLRAPNLPRLVGSRPGAELAERLGLPVAVDNEATLGALAHLDLAPDFVYVSAGIGIGGGIVLGGRVYRGAHGLAGELGHVVVDRAGPECGCGGRGCVERYAGTAALLADAGAADVDALATALARGEPRQAEATARAAAALGVGLASVLNVLDLPVVVLGGTYARLMRHVGPALQAELACRSLAPAPVRVLASGHGEAAATRGAAEAVLDAVQRNPDRLLA